MVAEHVLVPLQCVVLGFCRFAELITKRAIVDIEFCGRHCTAGKHRQKVNGCSVSARKQCAQGESSRVAAGLGGVPEGFTVEQICLYVQICVNVQICANL